MSIQHEYFCGEPAEREHLNHPPGPVIQPEAPEGVEFKRLALLHNDST
jgi:hypothetical protein